MFEKYTFEYILSQMLNRVSDEYDKREGSLMYIALAPAAAELAIIYTNLDAYVRSKWIATATDEDLDNFAYMFGVERKRATYAIVKGVFMDNTNRLMSLPLESRFSCNGVCYFATEVISAGVYELQAEIPGEGGNQTGTLLPISYIENLATCNIESVLIFGENIEKDEVFRARLMKNITQRSQDGNIAQYIEWAEAFDGIGKAKVFPLSDGDITEVSIIDPQGHPASTVLINDFQNYLDPGTEGLGNGKAPIGAKIRVITAEALEISVSVEIAGTVVEEDIKNSITEYLSKISFVKNAVSYFQIASEISNLNGVDEIQNFKINGGITDILIKENQVPMLISLAVTYK